jgi:hypothetical protein
MQDFGHGGWLPVGQRVGEMTEPEICPHCRALTRPKIVEGWTLVSLGADQPGFVGFICTQCNRAMRIERPDEPIARIQAKKWVRP